jgi:hypothetical protein
MKGVPWLRLVEFRAIMEIF